VGECGMERKLGVEKRSQRESIYSTDQVGRHGMGNEPQWDQGEGGRGGRAEKQQRAAREIAVASGTRRRRRRRRCTARGWLRARDCSRPG